jgi:regulatory protein
MLASRTEAPETANERGPGGSGMARKESPSTSAMSPAAVAQGICLRLLTARPRSRAELADALRGRGIPAEVSKPVLDRLGELGLVNDAALAESAVYSGHSHRGLGRKALNAELRRRGVSEEVAREALAAIGPEDEERQARLLVRRKLRLSTTGAARNGSALVRRLTGMLARKGYSEGLAFRVVREELGPDSWPTEIEPCPD